MSSQSNGTSLRADGAKLLFAILEQGQSSRSLLKQAQSKYNDARDKAWLQEMVFGVLRQLPILQFWLRRLLEKPLKGNKKVLEHLLLLGLYQLAYSRVPAHAAIGETVNATRKLNAQSLKGLVNAVLREFQRSDLAQQLPDSAAALAGLPNWLFKQIVDAYPTQAEQIIANTNAKAPVWLRVNRQQTSRNDYIKRLDSSNISFSIPETHQDAIILDKQVDITSLPGYADGLFAVQDGAAQLAADYMQPQPNDRVLDCCAAPGGKTCHLLEREPSIECIAIDNDASRLTRVEENLARLKLSARVVCADAADTNSWWDKTPFDRILLDAPCSATGVIRRHPDIRWLRKASDIDTLVEIQSTLLHALWQTLKPGGTMVYATCSILPQENQQQIAQFLKVTPNAQLCTKLHGENIGRQLLPGEAQMDGFYYARLLKSE
ncbi:16S rRNA (cytosine(967)-C(5))-methyltransferase RsmB [Alteromonas facilis]|uniref:16S rRNA (cytosine(967)-C(5))-methyltransferase RsmB n=1 Tax=Alteromonas facilis TaxID=2048004 RepID=UPI000C28ECD5|nr:16S rRNA (cytosine(967)-C(5))-methyltransferase RsmB [Alteromonas facilis]